MIEMVRSIGLSFRSLLLAAALASGGFAAVSFTAVTPSVASTDVIQQVQLSEKMIEGFIAAQKDMAKVAEKIQGSANDKPDPKIQAELEGVAKTHGFKDFAQYDDVAANISMVMAGIDPQSGTFTDPVESIKKEIAEVTADKSIKDADRKTMLEELNEALKVTQPIKFQENVVLVKKYREKIDAVLQ
jgi:hypothetical protein